MTTVTIWSTPQLDEFGRKVRVRITRTVHGKPTSMVSFDPEGHDARCANCDSRHCYDGCGSGIEGFVYVKLLGWYHADDIEVLEEVPA